MLFLEREKKSQVNYMLQTLLFPAAAPNLTDAGLPFSIHG